MRKMFGLGKLDTAMRGTLINNIFCFQALEVSMINSAGAERHSPRFQISTKIRSFSQNLIEQKTRPPPIIDQDHDAEAGLQGKCCPDSPGFM